MLGGCDTSFHLKARPSFSCESLLSFCIFYRTPFFICFNRLYICGCRSGTHMVASLEISFHATPTVYHRSRSSVCFLACLCFLVCMFVCLLTWFSLFACLLFLLVFLSLTMFASLCFVCLIPCYFWVLSISDALY